MEREAGSRMEREALAERPVSASECLTIAIQIADVMLTKAGAKLLDFGLAKTGPATAPAAASMLPTTPPALTQTGTVLGTTELRRMLDRMLTGQGGIALVGGEPGVGKTRLARELLREAHERGCMCLTGHCYEMEGAPPFVPFIEITEQAVRIVPQAMRAAMGDLAPDIAVIVASLRRIYADDSDVSRRPVGSS